MGLSQSICRLVLLPSTVGMIVYGCRPLAQPASEVAVLDETAIVTKQPDSEQPEASPEKAISTEAAEKTALTTQANAYQSGINLASGAHTLSQSAVIN